MIGPYSPDIAMDLWKQIGFARLSSTQKRVLAAVWALDGVSITTHPQLTDSDKRRVWNIMQEDGFEVLQDVIAAATGRG